MRIRFQTELTEGMSIPTYNFLFHPGIKQGRRPYLYKDEKVEKFQKFLISKFQTYPVLLQIAAANRKTPLVAHVDFLFTFHKRFFVRDVSNGIKAIEDALVKVLGIDDSHFLRVSGTKECGKKDMPEKVDITITLFHKATSDNKIYLPFLKRDLQKLLP